MSIDVPITYDGKKLPDGFMEKIETEIKEVEALPICVTRVFVPENGGPPQYAIRLAEGAMLFDVRLKVQDLGYELGQNMGAKKLGFYVSKRREETGGWDV
jgi:hypothetical protein